MFLHMNAAVFSTHSRLGQAIAEGELTHSIRAQLRTRKHTQSNSNADFCCLTNQVLVSRLRTLQQSTLQQSTLQRSTLQQSTLQQSTIAGATFAARATVNCCNRAANSCNNHALGPCLTHIAMLQQSATMCTFRLVVSQ